MVTPAIYNGFTFDGVDSKQYGVFITDVKVFGAPVREVEAVSIPGRNGDLLIDHGRYNNIDVVYSAVIHDMANFETIMASFRNALASRTSYKVLEDDINQNEFRLATFKDGLDVSTLNKKTGQFDITFNCKPQRFLNSGLEDETFTADGSMTNPTLYASKPLLEVTGIGDLTIGDVVASISGETTQTIYIDCDLMETYSISGGQVSPKNTLVTLSGNEYPTLAPGTNAIELDGITSVTITPRWWQL